MGGVLKALLPLGGKPLIQHVIDRVHPQVGQLMISVERPSEAFGMLELQQVEDPEPDRGPLMGLLSAMRVMDPAHQWLLLVPCDAPFAPPDLAARLLSSALAAGRPAAVVCYESEIHMAGLKQFLDVIGPQELDWGRSQRSPFFNVNDQGALLEAGRLLEY
jgi:molybdopterin-guanine dinucleotide biosynthesis protein A